MGIGTKKINKKNQGIRLIKPQNIITPESENHSEYLHSLELTIVELQQQLTEITTRELLLQQRIKFYERRINELWQIINNFKHH